LTGSDCQENAKSYRNPGWSPQGLKPATGRQASLPFFEKFNFANHAKRFLYRGVSPGYSIFGFDGSGFRKEIAYLPGSYEPAIFFS